MELSLDQGTELCRLLADTSRLRLLLLLERYPLSVAELTEITGLAQSRVSTHLAKLVRAGLVATQRSTGAVAGQYSIAEQTGDAGELWQLMRDRIADTQAQLDREHAEQVIRARKSNLTWAETVAGRMERHYSPGRTWEATAHALIGLLDLGDVLDLASGDGVLAELLHDHARSIMCVDISAKVLAAAHKRLRHRRQISLCRADMHNLPFAAESFDHIFLMHALSFTDQPARVLAACSRLLRSGGRLIVATLKTHRHEAAMQAYDHLNLGIRPHVLDTQLRKAGLEVETCRVTSREQRPPYFEVITALARKN